MAEQLYTTNEVCEILKITRRTLYRWMEDGKIEGVKVGETWRFCESEIAKFTGGDVGEVDALSLKQAMELLRLYRSGELQKLILEGKDLNIPTELPKESKDND